MLNLLNRTQIPYRNLVIPCCKQCNGTHLSNLENRVKRVFTDPSRSLDEISDEDLNAWISKIYIGTHWKELELKFDRKEPRSKPILPRESMENFRMMHFFMQSCRKSMTFNGPNGVFPNSLLRVQCKVPQEIVGQFDYLDNFAAHTVAIRIGDKGVVGIFDGGMHTDIFPDFAELAYGNNALHPIQFREVFAKLTYKSILSLRVPFFGIFHEEMTDRYVVSLMAFDDHDKEASCVSYVSHDGQRLLMVPVLPKAAQEGNAYSEWSQEKYARGLSWYTGIPLDQVFTPPDLVMSFLRDDNDDFIDIPIDALD